MTKKLVINHLQIKRGLKADLPTLLYGELGYCTDTEELYIGTNSGVNKLLNPEVDLSTIEEKIGEVKNKPAQSFEQNVLDFSTANVLIPNVDKTINQEIFNYLTQDFTVGVQSTTPLGLLFNQGAYGNDVSYTYSGLRNLKFVTNNLEIIKDGILQPDFVIRYRGDGIMSNEFIILGVGQHRYPIASIVSGTMEMFDTNLSNWVPLDDSDAVISQDGMSITHPSLTSAGVLVSFKYNSSNGQIITAGGDTILSGSDYIVEASPIAIAVIEDVLMSNYYVRLMYAENNIYASDTLMYEVSVILENPPIYSLQEQIDDLSAIVDNILSQLS